MFKVGDVVELKSGGPPMTVKIEADKNTYMGQEGEVNCIWFDGKKPCSDGFRPETLRLVDETTRL